MKSLLLNQNLNIHANFIKKEEDKRNVKEKNLKDAIQASQESVNIECKFELVLLSHFRIKFKILFLKIS